MYRHGLMPSAKALPLLEPADGQGVVRCFPSLTEHPMTDRAAPPADRAHAHSCVGVVAVLIVPVGLGGALAVPALTAMLLDAVPADRSGTAGAVLNTARPSRRCDHRGSLRRAAGRRGSPREWGTTGRICRSIHGRGWRGRRNRAIYRP